VRAALLIARKDLRQRLRDRSAFIYGLLAPLGLAFIFSMVLNPVTNSKFSATYVVLDYDHGQISQAFTQVLDGLKKNEGFTVREVPNLNEAKAEVARGADPLAGDEKPKADAAFMLPSLLSQKVMSGQGGTLTVIGATGSDLAAPVALSIANGFAAEMAAVEVAVRTALPAGSEHDQAKLAALSQQAAQTVNPVTVEDVSTTTKQLSQTTYMAAGMAVFFLFFTVSFGVSGLLEERRIGTMNRLLGAPIKPASIVVGKAITSFVLGLISMTALVIASTTLFGAHWGNPVGVALLVVSAIFSATGILFVVAATAKTQDQAGSFQAIISLVLAFLGGTFFNVSQGGGLLATLSLITPHAWFLRGLGDLQGGQVGAVLPSVAALLAFGLITSAIAWPFLRRAVEQ
jgi:ABC-2 type transport system permease protein